MTTAALRLTQASARISSAGIFSVEMSKWCSERSVCAPHRRSAATAMSPKVSFSMRCSAMAESCREVCTAMPESAPVMPLIPFPLARPFLFGLDPEHAHELTLAALAAIQRTPLVALDRAAARARPGDDRRPRLSEPHRPGRRARQERPLHRRLRRDGLRLRRGRHGDAAGAAGQSEAAPVPPPEAGALINRLGFNNDGLAAFIANVRQARFRARGGILGLNIGKNAATPIERAADDYLLGLAGVYPHADYVTVNISSPNTQNLRTLQSRRRARRACSPRSRARRAELADEHGRKVPMFLKIAPDLDAAQIEAIAAIVAAPPRSTA